MKLKTSFFNAAVLKKDITRFAPVWGLYTIFALLSLIENDATVARTANDLVTTLYSVNGTICLYAGICVLCLFGDLFVPRLAGALHAMPLKREGWFFTHSLAALLFFLVPSALYATLLSFTLGSFSYLAWIWLAIAGLQFLFYLGVAVFCMQCAGNRLGATVTYLLVNYLPMLIMWLITLFCEPVLYGVIISDQLANKLSPASQFYLLHYVDWEFNYTLNTAVFRGFIGKDWLYLGISALAGVGLMAISVLMYRRRKLERAGSFIAFQPAAPVFLVLYTLCVGAIMTGMSVGYGAVGFLLFGLALGWFTGHMLLERRVKVFRKKVFFRLAIFLVVLFLSEVITFADPLGITQYVPQPSQVVSVDVGPYEYSSYTTVTDPAQIEKLTQIHRDLTQGRKKITGNEIWLKYTLKNGQKITRYYDLDIASANGQWLKTLYSAPETVFGSEDKDLLMENIRFAKVYAYNPDGVKGIDAQSWDVGQADWAALLDAMMADSQEGNLAQLQPFHRGEDPIAEMEIQFDTVYRSFIIYPCAEHTAAVLESMSLRLNTQ